MQSSALSAPIRNCPTNQHSVSKHHLTCWNSPSQYLEICFINLSGTALNPDRHGRRCLKYLRSYWLRRRTSVSVFPVASQSKPAGSIPVTIRRTNRSSDRDCSLPKTLHVEIRPVTPIEISVRVLWQKGHAIRVAAYIMREYRKGESAKQRVADRSIGQDPPFYFLKQVSLLPERSKLAIVPQTVRKVLVCGPIIFLFSFIFTLAP